MQQDDKAPRTLENPNAGLFAGVLQEVIREGFGTQDRLAQACGVSPSWMNQILNDGAGGSPKSLKKILIGLPTVEMQKRVRKAWASEFTPFPRADADGPAHEVIRQCDALVKVGDVRTAASFGTKALRASGDSKRFHLIAERVAPLLLRLERVSDALRLQSEVEKRALERNDTVSILSALASYATILRSVDGAPFDSCLAAHARVRDEALKWHPKGEAEERAWAYRLACIHREYALLMVKVSDERRGEDKALKAGAASICESLSYFSEDFMLVLALEVRARIEQAQGDLRAAERTLDDLNLAGMNRGAELWEKSEITRARMLGSQGSGKREEAIAALEAVRSHCLKSQNAHHFRKADQDLARLYCGIR